MGPVHVAEAVCVLLKKNLDTKEDKVEVRLVQCLLHG